MDVPPILTPRFELASMSLAFMRHLRDGDFDAASRELGATVPTTIREDLVDFLNYRIPSLEADPSIQPWIGRAIVVTSPDGRREAIGTIGFHGPPDVHGRVEIGYSVEPLWRRRAVATECVAALLAWAEAQGISRFRASVAPGNEPSLVIIRRLGFREVGSQIDEIDGLELVFELDR
ncbi:MAG TPA: GNAT family N-acetyltransferase [Candidatus Binatia bacterium]|nr:GNAT family N-acetyltransferase [Candidatus Binatia bacterium]